MDASEKIVGECNNIRDENERQDLPYVHLQNKKARELAHTCLESLSVFAKKISAEIKEENN